MTLHLKLKEMISNWMAIAQCFAGAPENPPQKGARFVQN